MAQGVKRIVAVPVLAGFALSLMVLATLVGSVRADAACDSCRGQSFYRSQLPGGVCYGKMGQDMFLCLNVQAQKDCNDRGICPGGANPSATCAGTFSDDPCLETGGTGICTNDCWGFYCNSTTTHTCRDTQTETQSLVSACNVSCTCVPLQ